MLLNYILRKCSGGYKFTKPQKIKHLVLMDHIKISGENEKELEPLTQTLRIYSQDLVMEFGIEKYTMLIMKKGGKGKSRITRTLW